jgi:hypothetical protein
MSGFSCAK